MTERVRVIAREIVQREGGYVNDPDDPGGATNFGVTIATARRLGLDKTGDGRVTEQDVRALTREDAEQVYLDHYYLSPNIDHLPEALQASVFDMYVNAGNRAVKLLQNLVSRMGFPATEDGVIGAQTVAAVDAAFRAAPDHIVDAYGIARRNFYYRLADRRPASRKYARRRNGRKGGWIKRAETFIDPFYHFSDADHLARTGGWS